MREVGLLAASGGSPLRCPAMCCAPPRKAVYSGQGLPRLSGRRMEGCGSPGRSVRCAPCRTSGNGREGSGGVSAGKVPEKRLIGSRLLQARPTDFVQGRLTPLDVEATDGNIQALAALKRGIKRNKWDYMRGHDPIELELEKDDSSKRITALKIYLAYVLLGVVAFSYVLGNWDVSDSIWFSLTTLTSVGYGDLTPTTPELKAFTIFYILLSSVITASVLGLALGSLFEKDIRFAEEMGIEETSRVLSTLVTPQRRPEDQTENHNEEGEKQQTESPKEWTEMPSYRPSRPAWWPYSILIQEFTRLSALLLMGGFGYHAMEPESFPTFLDGVYFTAATASTVGYGDLVPKTTGARFVTMLVIPAAVLTFALAVERTAAAFTVARREQREQSMLAKALDLADLERMDLDKNGKVTREEFMLFMLTLLGRVNPQDVEMIYEQFNRFDVTGEGVIDGRDLLEMEKAYAESLMQRYSDPITYSKLSSRRWRKRKMGRPTALTGRDIEVDGFPGGRPFLALRPLMKSQDAPPEESKGQSESE